MKNIFQIVNVFQIEGRGTVVTGTLISGVIKTGMTVIVGEKTLTVAGMEQGNKKLNEFTEQGGEAGILLSGTSAKKSFWSFTPTVRVSVPSGEYEFMEAAS